MSESTAPLEDGKFLILSDVENIWTGEYLDKLAAEIGKEAEVAKIREKGLSDPNYPWEEGLRERKKIIVGDGKQITFKLASKVAHELPITEGAYELRSTVQKYDGRIIGVSGGFTIVTDRLWKEERLFDYAVANELVFGEDGYLKEFKWPLNVDSNKANSVRREVRKYKVEQIIAIVDGKNDLHLYSLAGYRVSFNGVPLVRKYADIHRTGDLSLLCEPIVDYIKKL